MLRRFLVFAFALPVAAICSCGYHTLGAATHLPPGTRTLAVPIFATHTEAYHTEAALTDAVIREFAARSRMRITPAEGGNPDAVLRGTILNEVVAPLTYNTTTQQSSSFMITLVISVTLTDRDGKVLYQNKNYVYRGQYQSTTDLPTFLDESPAAVDRMARDFARALVADVLEGM
jgi:outer membrane lipopolysaccharide assembly protein LptE/RlpB